MVKDSWKHYSSCVIVLIGCFFQFSIDGWCGRCNGIIHFCWLYICTIWYYPELCSVLEVSKHHQSLGKWLPGATAKWFRIDRKGIEASTFIYQWRLLEAIRLTGITDIHLFLMIFSNQIRPKTSSNISLWYIFGIHSLQTWRSKLLINFANIFHETGRNFTQFIS